MFSASPAWSFTSSAIWLLFEIAAGFGRRISALIDFVKLVPFSANRHRRFRDACTVENLFPVQAAFPELRAPVADVVVADDAMAEQAQRALERIADAGGADVADVHRLGDVRRTEIEDDGFRLRGLVEKQMLAARGGFKRLRRATEFFSRKFRKPAPAISTFSQTAETSSLATTSVASWRGFSLRVLASDMRALLW